jgi:RNA polymerase sigma factor (sigma-70 family)
VRLKSPPSRNLKHSNSFNCHYTFRRGTKIFYGLLTRHDELRKCIWGRKSRGGKENPEDRKNLAIVEDALAEREYWASLNNRGILAECLVNSHCSTPVSPAVEGNSRWTPPPKGFFSVTGRENWIFGEWGRRVMHSAFGSGTVQQMECYKELWPCAYKPKPHYWILVDFDHGKPKRLDLTEAVASRSLKRVKPREWGRLWDDETLAQAMESFETTPEQGERQKFLEDEETYKRIWSAAWHHAKHNPNHTKFTFVESDGLLDGRITTKHQERASSPEDVFQEAYLALLKVIDKYKLNDDVPSLWPAFYKKIHGALREYQERENEAAGRFKCSKCKGKGCPECRGEKYFALRQDLVTRTEREVDLWSLIRARLPQAQRGWADTMHEQEIVDGDDLFGCCMARRTLSCDEYLVRCLGRRDREEIAQKITTLRSRQLNKAVNHVEDQYTVPLLLNCWDEISQEQIAERLGKNQSSISRAIDQGKKLIAQELSAYADLFPRATAYERRLWTKLDLESKRRRGKMRPARPVPTGPVGPQFGPKSGRFVQFLVCKDGAEWCLVESTPTWNEPDSRVIRKQRVSLDLEWPWPADFDLDSKGPTWCGWQPGPVWDWRNISGEVMVYESATHGQGFDVQKRSDGKWWMWRNPTWYRWVWDSNQLARVQMCLDPNQALAKDLAPADFLALKWGQTPSNFLANL